MAESVSFKAYLKRDGQDVEVRRFGIDGGAATNYAYLRGKIQAMFPSVQNDHFSVFWQDADNDYISISSDEELLVALTSSATVQPFKLYIQIKSQQEQGPGSSAQQVHANITCDGCEGAVVGRRYKCVTCPDFDLCVKCEANGLHPEHFMLRINTPDFGSAMNTRFMRKFFGRPHKHFKHGWGHMGAGEGGFAPPRPCPFTRGCGEGTSAATAGAGPSTGIGAVTDMFDFSALMEFINSLGVSMAAGQREASEPAAASTSAAGSQAQATPELSQPTTSTAQEPSQGQRPTARGPHPTQYLNNIGQAIAAMLDPFGVDVSFEVRPKEAGQPGSSQAEAGQSTPPATTPGPSSSPADTGFQTPRSEGSFAPQQLTIEEPRENSPINSRRRNSDDWTMLNRESPTRSVEVVAMDVEDNRGARPRNVYPELPKEAPSAPLRQTNTIVIPLPDASSILRPPLPLVNENQKIAEAIDKIRSMGFNFETSLLKELLRKENCDIASVIEKILTNKV